MAYIKMYLNKDVAALCGCSVEAVIKYAQKRENEINFLGEGLRRTYIWFDADIERFKLRPKPGRPKQLP